MGTLIALGRSGLAPATPPASRATLEARPAAVRVRPPQRATTPQRQQRMPLATEIDARSGTWLEDNGWLASESAAYRLDAASGRLRTREHALGALVDTWA